MDLSDLRKENAVFKEEKMYYFLLVVLGATADLRREMVSKIQQDMTIRRHTFLFLCLIFLGLTELDQ